MKTGVRAALAVVILAGVFFRFYHLDGKVFWEDEIFGAIHSLGYSEAEIVRAGPHLHHASDLQRYFALPGDGNRLGDTIDTLAVEDPQHPPVYYVLTHLWMERFGSSVAAIRTLSAIFGTIALPCAFWLAFELFGSVTLALIAAALVAVSPFHVLYAQEAREYSLWTVAILLNGVALLRALRLGTPVAWVLYAVSMIASMFVDPLSGLVALGQAAYVLALGGPARGRALLWFAGSMAITALAFFPWLRHMLHGGALRGLSGILGAKLSAATILLAFVRGVRSVFVDLGAFALGPIHSAPLNFALTVATTILAAYASWFLVRGAPRRVWAYVVFALCCPLLPVVAHDLISGGRLTYQGRYFGPLYLGLELAVAYLAYSALFAQVAAPPARRRFAGAALVAVLAAGIASCAISSRAPTWWNKDYEQSREIADVINTSPNALVVSDQGSSRVLGLGYYLDPNVALDVHMSCETCGIDADPGGDLLADAGRFSKVFLLGPSDVLAREAAPNGTLKSPFQTIGVGIYSGPASALNMFRPI